VPAEQNGTFAPGHGGLEAAHLGVGVREVSVRAEGVPVAAVRSHTEELIGMEEITVTRSHTQ
jgi:hypothetical protein